jgi:hypothetical protein
MFRNKKMALYILGAVVVFAVIVAVWWRVFFGTPNPQLPQRTISVQSSSSAGSAAGASSSQPVGTSAPVVDGENPPLAEETFSVDGANFNVEIASATLTQTRGLSFRPSLGANDGMLFVFSSGNIQTFWMKDMNFPLDMIWISGNTVVGFAQDVPAPAPGTQLWELPVYTSPSDTDKVLEVNSGTVAKYNIKVGDTVTIAGAK